MCRRLIFLISFVLVLSSVSSAAKIHWTALGADNLWSNPANWEGQKVPTSTDDAYIDVPAAEAPNGPLIRGGINAKAHGLACEVAGEPTMTMTGGTLEIADWVWWGDGADCHGTFYMSGGTITTGGDFELGWGGGEGTWIMTGGTVDVRELIIPTSSGRAGQLYLHGGTFNVRHEGLRMTETGLIDITKGTLLLEGDLTTKINDFIAAGQITAYGGAGTVLVTYGGQTTTVVAIGAPEATNPNPADEATDVPRDVVLSWTPGEYAPPVNGHRVYFSENFNDVNDGIGGITQDANSYAPPQRLNLGTTYYWRVDEVNGPPDFTVFKGEVWQFTTEPFSYPVENIIATASSQFNANTGPEKTIDGSGLDADDLHSTEEAAIWVSSMTGPQPTWIQYEFDRVYKLHQMWVWNHNTSIEPVVGFGFKDVTIEYSTNGTDWAVLADVPEFARAPGQDGYAHNTTIDFGSTLAKYVRLTANSNFGGILPQYGLSEVRFFYIPVVAREPNPASGATDVDVEAVLSWRAGREAASHHLYLSSDEQAVIDETVSAVSIPAGGSYANYAAGPLDLSKSYYWKVNEVNEAETPTTWQGDVWNFSTQEYLVVDDFEDYN
ncbi:MAG: discoidin domain-containing protein, partial [Sedimentisphaerales bacterium]